MITVKADKLVHLLGREAIDEVLRPYRRPNDKLIEWLRSYGIGQAYLQP